MRTTKLGLEPLIGVEEIAEWIGVPVQTIYDYRLSDGRRAPSTRHAPALRGRRCGSGSKVNRSLITIVIVLVVTSKESERFELHKSIWRIANNLCGSIDGCDFKTYVLGVLFYCFISENLTVYLNEQKRLAGNEGSTSATWQVPTRGCAPKDWLAERGCSARKRTCHPPVIS